jgi:hypothetical protein
MAIINIMKFKIYYLTTILFITLLSSAQDTALLTIPRCTLIVNTDNGEIVDVWINRQKVGNTPFQIDTLLPGFYDISFMNPYFRDSILNTSLPTHKTTNPIPLESTASLACGFSDNELKRRIEYASGELARESNVKITLQSNHRSIVLFKAGEAKKHIESERNKGTNKVVLGVMFSTICIAGIIIYYIHTIIYTTPPY